MNIILSRNFKIIYNGDKDFIINTLDSKLNNLNFKDKRHCCKLIKTIKEHRYSSIAFELSYRSYQLIKHTVIDNQIFL